LAYIYHTDIFYLFEMKINDTVYAQNMKNWEHELAIENINPTFPKFSFVVKIGVKTFQNSARVWLFI
jgi:hypothetical protein